MSSKTNYYENLLLKAFEQNDSAARAEFAAMSPRLALYTSTLSETSENAATNEVSGSGYSRVSAATLAGGFGTAPSAGTITSDATIAWPTFSGATSPILAVGWVDNTTNKLWKYLNLSSSVTPGSGTVVQFTAGSLVVVEG